MRNTIVELNQSELKEVTGGWLKEAAYIASPFIGLGVGFSIYLCCLIRQRRYRLLESNS